jgi:hypothetical protein
MKTKTMWIINAILAISLTGVLIAANADGDKDRRQNPVIDYDGDIVGLVTPNVECVAVPSPDQSGVIVYFCTEADD